MSDGIYFLLSHLSRVSSDQNSSSSPMNWDQVGISWTFEKGGRGFMCVCFGSGADEQEGRVPGRPGANVAPVRDPGGKSGCRSMDMIGKVHLSTCTEAIEEFDKPRNEKTKQQPNFGFYDTSKKPNASMQGDVCECVVCVCKDALLGGKNELVSPFPPRTIFEV